MYYQIIIVIIADHSCEESAFLQIAPSIRRCATAPKRIFAKDAVQAGKDIVDIQTSSCRDHRLGFLCG
jgi:hypothetical protein